MDEKPSEEENDRNDQEGPLWELLDGRLVLRSLYKQLSETNFIEALNKNFDIAGSDVSGTIGSMRLMIEQLEQEKTSPTMEDFTQLKEMTVNLDAQFTDYRDQTSNLVDMVKGNADFLVSASLAKTIPSLEHRVAKLEETIDKKRTWGLGVWGLVIGVFGSLFGCLAIIVAIGVWLLPR
jgi:hypothetical protein